MTQTGSILVVDVATPSLVAMLLFLCSKAVTKKTTVKSTPSSVCQRSKRTKIHHCMLFSLQPLQFVIQWSSSLNTELSHTSRADQDKRTQISKTSKNVSSKHSYQSCEMIPCTPWRMFCPKIIPASSKESFVEFRQNPIVVGWISL
jgi:hypothetical protein